MSIKALKDGVVLVVYVKPSSSKKQISFTNGEIIIETKEKPSRNDANIDVIRQIAKTMGVPLSSIHILRGQTSKLKEILIKGITDAEALNKLSKINNIDNNIN